MPVVENNLLTRLTIIAVALTIGGTTIAWLDGRHASASDVSELRTSIEKERLDRIEFEIEAIERRQRNITRMLDEDQSKAMHLAKKLNVNFPVLFDTEKDVSRSFDIKAMPTTIIIDRAGKIRHVNRGFKNGYIERYHRQIQALRKE